jgi:hypothetical protein
VYTRSKCEVRYAATPGHGMAGTRNLCKESRMYMTRALRW